MRVTVLGGSAAGGNIGAGCSGYLVESRHTKIVADLGPGTLLELRKHTDFRSLDAVIISHLHVDHVLDLMALRFALAYNPVRPAGPIPLWLPPGGKALLENLARTFGDNEDAAAYFGEVFTFEEYDPDRGLSIGDVEVSFAPTVHYIPCWAMRFQQRGSETSIGYTADTGPAVDLMQLLNGVTVLIAEATLVTERSEPFESRGHLTANEAGKLAAQVGATALVLTHMWEEVGFERYITAARASFQGRIVAAAPGQRVEC